MIGKTLSSESWFEAEVRRQRRHAAGDTDQAVSSQWGHAKTDADERDRLFDLLTAVRNFCRLMDVPPETEIRIANCSEVGTACAGFYDSPDSFLQPFILIDEGIFDRCSVSDCMDIAVGLAIHEAMHVLQTRQGYVRLANKKRDQRLNSLENLIEDWRIEELCRRDFVGYTDYLYKLRRVLIVDKSLLQAMQHWDTLPDVDKIMLIVVAYIRAPQLLVDLPELQTWQDLQDRNIYQYLRKYLPTAPTTEHEVEVMALRLFRLIDDYRNRSLQYLADHDKITPDTIRRIRHQEQANAIDNSLKRHHNPLVRRRFSPADLNVAQILDDSVRQGSSEQTVARINKLDRKQNQPSSTPEQRGDTPLPEQHLPSVFRGKIEFVHRPSHPLGKSAYQRALRHVQGDIARLKRSFQLDAGGSGLQTNRSNGKLDRRRLYRAPFDATIFSQITAEEPAKTMVALLIDSSGSMSENARFRRAIEVAVMFNEAFINHPTITLRTYSHTSSESGELCRLVYHGEASPHARESIGSMGPMFSNYDHQALWGVVAHLAAEASSYPRKILLSVSDGLPCLPFKRYGTGVAATRKAVEDVRRLGWTVFGIGIGDLYAEKVYGKRWTLRVPNEATLPQNMSSLLIKLIRRYQS